MEIDFYKGFNEKGVVSSCRLGSQREIHVQEHYEEYSDISPSVKWGAHVCDAYSVWVSTDPMVACSSPGRRAGLSLPPLLVVGYRPREGATLSEVALFS